MYHEYITLHYINIKGIISTINTRISRYQVSLLCRNMVKINSILHFQKWKYESEKCNYEHIIMTKILLLF